MGDKVEKKSDLIPVRKSHIAAYKDFPLYYISDSGEPVLFRKVELLTEKLQANSFQEFYIRKEDEKTVVKVLMSLLNMRLAKAVASKGIQAIRQSIGQIVEEVLENPEHIMPALPETIEILFFNAKKTPELLDALVSMNNTSPKIIDHIINVLALTGRYCFFKEMPDDDVKRFGLCALLHDVGLSQIETRIIEKEQKLTQSEFDMYKTHPDKSYTFIISHPVFDKTIAHAAREHHECLDGSGYPKGIHDISFEGQVIGLIDSYEALKYREKAYRKGLKSYDALQIIKSDVVQGKYNKQVFVDLCKCLIK